MRLPLLLLFLLACSPTPSYEQCAEYIWAITCEERVDEFGANHEKCVCFYED